MDQAAIRRNLLGWYARNRRSLPWRRTREPYRIWVSEIMLQQTRVAAVIPYFERFLKRFPRLEDLATASEREVLSVWSGLGYYSRARNMQKAARQIVSEQSLAGGFPRDYASIRALAGVGDYTAAAVASIAFGLPHAAIDGNVRRVIVRLTGNAATNVSVEAAGLLDQGDPGQWNQALMELGAMVCLPHEPLCPGCPLARQCEARRRGVQRELPSPRKKPAMVRRELTFLVIRRNGRILLTPSPRVPGFWDLPEAFSGVRLGPRLGTFRHSITNSQYHCEVREAGTGAPPRDCRWWDESKLGEIPLSTAAKKALRCLEE